METMFCGSQPYPIRIEGEKNNKISKTLYDIMHLLNGVVEYFFHSSNLSIYSKWAIGLRVERADTSAQIGNRFHGKHKYVPIYI